MLRSLLAERFKLVIKSGTRPVRNSVRAVVLASRSRRRARQAVEAPVQSEAEA